MSKPILTENETQLVIKFSIKSDAHQVAKIMGIKSHQVTGCLRKNREAYIQEFKRLIEAGEAERNPEFKRRSGLIIGKYNAAKDKKRTGKDLFISYCSPARLLATCTAWNLKAPYNDMVK